ncbi:hypothetical protein [Desulfohalovibrio reitneri]|uniref:hypothetical protein n=1 Tax=Desulfohalovibrio reitneri TaxID=1307759 RepID=UPI00068D2B2D|nr:hypothetical protein [Desulfohalovibrio reitneri]
MDPVSIIAGLASVAPTIAKWLAGEGSEAQRVAEKAAGVAMRVTGAASPEEAVELVRTRQEFALEFEKVWAGVEMGLQKELTRRHQADMRHGTALSRNVRPLCLLCLTFAVVAGTFWGVAEEAKFAALTEMSLWVYGYYFLGRSAFDKGAVKLRLGRPGLGGMPDNATSRRLAAKYAEVSG